MEKKYRFITFEGIDGSGKTTMAKMMFDYLTSMKYKVFLTSETKSIDSEFVKKITDILMEKNDIPIKSELLLFGALRNYHFEKIMKKKFSEGYIVICDRFVDSSIVYQGLKGLKIKEINFLNNFSTDNLIPSLTFLLNVSADLAYERINSRVEKKTKFDNYDKSFFDKANNEYLKIASKNKKRIKVIDASKNTKEVFEIIKLEVNKWLK